MVMDRKAVSRDYSSLTEEERKTLVSQKIDKMVEIAVSEALSKCDLSPTEAELKALAASKVASVVDVATHNALLDIVIACMEKEAEMENELETPKKTPSQI